MDNILGFSMLAWKVVLYLRFWYAGWASCVDIGGFDMAKKNKLLVSGDMAKKNSNAR